MGVIPPAVTWITGEAVLSFLQTRKFLVVKPEIKEGQPATYKAAQEQFGSDANICRNRPEMCQEGNPLNRTFDIVPIPLPGTFPQQTIDFGKVPHGHLLRLGWFVVNALTAFRA